MIGLSRGTCLNLKKTNDSGAEPLIGSFLEVDESIISANKAWRANVFFTNKKIVIAKAKGLVGTKKDYTTIPYPEIKAYCVEKARADESFKNNRSEEWELELYTSKAGKIKFVFKGKSDIREIYKTISELVGNQFGRRSATYYWSEGED